jgi:hypothetical protein
LFGEGEEPGTQAARFDYLNLEPAQEKKLAELDRSFGNETAKLRERVVQYAQKHRLLMGFEWAAGCRCGLTSEAAHVHSARTP